MASHIEYYEHPHTKAVKSAPVGFSWTTFFFCFFPALFRGDWKWGILIFILWCVSWIIPDPVGWVWALSVFLIFAVIYNRLWTDDLIKRGFKRVTGQSNQNVIINNVVSVNTASSPTPEPETTKEEKQ